MTFLRFIGHTVNDGGRSALGSEQIEFVHRFKGRAAPCVVLTEIDFEQLDTAAVRRLYVGATRATVKLALVLSARAAHLLNLSATGESR